MKKILLFIALISSLSLFADGENKLIKLDPKILLIEEFATTFIKAFNDTTILPLVGELKRDAKNLEEIKYMYDIEYINDDINSLKNHFEYDALIGSMVLDHRIGPHLFESHKSDKYFYVVLKYYFDIMDWAPNSYKNIIYGVTSSKDESYFQFDLVSDDGIKRNFRFYINGWESFFISDVRMTAPMFQTP